MTFHHGVLWMRRADGTYQEVFNHARTAHYLDNPALALPSNAPAITDVLDFGGCPAYAFEPPCADVEYIDGFAETPGTTGNGLQIPDAAALDIITDIGLIADVALDDWTPGSERPLIGKWSTAGQLSYLLTVDAFGTPFFRWTTDGSTINSIGADVNLGGMSPGARQAIRVDFDVNNGAAGRTAHFFRAPTHDGPWVRMGTPRTTATATSIFSGSSTVQMGLATGFNAFDGKIFHGQVRTGPSFVPTLAGAAVANIDPSVVQFASQTTFLATTGQTVSVLRSGTPSTILNPGPGYWEEQTYSTPAIDNAPWYHPAFPATADGLGFFITEWTGLDGAHVVRPVSRTGRPGGGGQHGALRGRERVMKMNVLMFARSEQGMNALYDWLENLLYSVCATCSVDSILVRRECPPIVNTGDSLWQGAVEMREVALTEGLTWVNALDDAGHCFIRQASFTLTAADPCMYSNGVAITGPQANAVPTTCYAGIPLGEGSLDCRPHCYDLISSCRSTFTFDLDPLSGVAPVLTLRNSSDHAVLPLRVLISADPNEIGVSSPCSLPIIGQLYTRVLPPWSELVWDVAGRTITYSDHTTGGPVDGAPYIDANDPPFNRFFTLGCGLHHVIVEPGNWCLEDDVPNAQYVYQGQGFTKANLHYPTLSLEIVERLGCP